MLIYKHTLWSFDFNWQIHVNLYNLYLSWIFSYNLSCLFSYKLLMRHKRLAIGVQVQASLFLMNHAFFQRITSLICTELKLCKILVFSYEIRINIICYWVNMYVSCLCRFPGWLLVCSSWLHAVAGRESRSGAFLYIYLWSQRNFGNTYKSFKKLLTDYPNNSY